MANHRKPYKPYYEDTHRYFYKEDNEGNGYLELDEFTFDDWRNYVSTKTKFFKKQRGSVKGKEVKVAQVVDYDFDRNILTILTEPTYNFDAWTYPDGRKGDYSPNQNAVKDNVYTIEVLFEDIDKWRDKPWQDITLAEWKEMMKVVDVKWNCTCKSFYWQSHRHELTTLDGAIYPYKGPDKGIWKKRHNNQSGLCKHLAAIAPLVGGFQASIVLGKIRDAAKRKGIEE